VLKEIFTPIGWGKQSESFRGEAYEGGRVRSKRNAKNGEGIGSMPWRNERL
jgi:hypothetical protein